jgi:16S rRNA (guanine966-N2)-methyltransferase
VGGKVRPTTAKVLESLVAILAPRTPEARVLDVFAGTGRVGLRLAEEGAEAVVFVEGNRKVAKDLRATIADHEDRERLSLVVGSVPKILNRVRGQYNLAVCDPPYDWKEPSTLLRAASKLVLPGGLLVVEHHHKTPYEVVRGWSLQREEKFGETRLSFFERQSEA